MNTLDDATLILQFVKQDVTLASNQNMRVEPAFDSVQLLTKRGGLIASLKATKDAPTVMVRRGSEYWSLIHNILVENSFIPVNQSLKSELIQYQVCQIPAGYKPHSTEAKILWKEWWTGLRQDNRNNIQTDLLVFCRNTWYPVREIVCTHGSLFITTLVSESVHQGSDLVNWLSKKPDEPVRHNPETPIQPKKLTHLAQTNNPVGTPNKPTFRQTPEKAPFVGKEGQPSRASNPATNQTQEKEGNTVMRPDLREVLKFRQGKLYIMTAVGEVVVEGTNLKFWLNDDEVPGIQKTVNISTYRDRESQAVNS